MSENTKTFFYHDKPLFGMDIGFSSIKVMQIDPQSKDAKRKVTGYGTAHIPPSTDDKGTLTNPQGIAEAMYNLFEKNIVGEITSRRVAIAIPSSSTFTRTLTLPLMAADDMRSAVQLDTEQFVPVPVKDLYIDYNVIGKREDGIDILTVAVPKKIVGSYLTLAKLLNLEVISIQSTIGAEARLFVQSELSDVPTVLIDLGTLSTDITIHDNTIVVSGTVAGGGEIFTKSIADKLGLSVQEAHTIKTKYGLGVSKKQQDIRTALSPTLDQLVKELRRLIRYYEERGERKKKISQIVTMGGGASMPGLSDYLTDILRLPVRMIDPWQHLQFGNLQQPNSADKSMYVTVAGLALTEPKELFS